ncbi:LytTR family transcriptional regulator DNA-binding domain-containing protein [Sphingomonas adhaesiva]|uniref:LytTR family transcriptional regulator DNA-binding domain-containing protein n=1 Tax=Sphingomonas adhaesiva TaxID=28212 RepID=UPI002FF80315
MTRPAFSIAAARQAVLPLARWIGIAVAAGMLLAILGPFGSYLNGGPVRLLGYWIGAMLLGLALYGSAYRLVGCKAAPSSRKWWLGLVVAALLASIPEALATRAAAFRLWPELSRIHLPLPLWFAQTATIGLVAMAGIGVIMNRPASKAGDTPAPPPAAMPMVTPLAGDVLALQMEDHYVRVHRPAGSELVLMPLGRAIEAMQVDGLRTHRSWWVAAHAVAAVEGNARAMRLRLSNGVIAPVARTAVIHLKTAGWLVDAKKRVGSRVSA